MHFVKKYIYLFHFAALFLFTSIWAYFKNWNLSWFGIFLLSLWVVIAHAFVDWAWDSKKYKKK